MLFLADKTIEEDAVEKISPEAVIDRLIVPAIVAMNRGADECQEFKDALYHLGQATLALNAREERLARGTAIIQ